MSFRASNESYSSWADQHRKLGELLKGCSRVAMQYSPNCAIPQISLVDAGTVELVRSFDVRGRQFGKSGAELRGMLDGGAACTLTWRPASLFDQVGGMRST